MKIKIAIFLLAVCWQTVEGDGNFNTSWAFFLGNLSNYLSGPTIQLNIKGYLVNDLKEWGNCSINCRTIQSMLAKIDDALKHANVHDSLLKKSDHKAEIVDALKFVNNYIDTTELIRKLESSNSNFNNNETLIQVGPLIEQVRNELIQTGCSKLYVAKPNHCITAKGNGPPHISKKNFKDFLYKLKMADNKTFHNFICWANVELSENQFNEINSVLALNLKSKLDKEGVCIGNRMIFSGNIVRISDTHLDSVQKCSQNESHEEIIHIMASDKIYIDEDINFKRKKLLLAIMAPTVVVVGEKRKIVLYGNDEASGEKRPRGLEKFFSTFNNSDIDRNDFHESLVCGIYKQRNQFTTFDMLLNDARESWSTVKSNMTALHYYIKDKPVHCYYDKTVKQSPHGVPGLPGDTGGSFFGLADVFENSSKLTIISHGGMGGFGQHGAYGFDGKEGKKGIEKISSGFNYKGEPVNFVTGLKHCDVCDKRTIHWNEEDGRAVDPEQQILLKNRNKVWFYGQIAVRGTDGGNGGAGGYGGNAGQIRIITFNQIDSSKKNARNGRNGPPGLAGKGGKGWNITPKQHVYVVDYHENNNNKILAIRYQQPDPHSPEAKLSGNGKDGIDGNNTQGMQSPTPAVDIKANLGSLIIDYRTMLKTDLENQFSREKIFNHLMSILENKELTNNCSTSNIINDLLEYENLFIKLHDKINYTKLYVTLQNQTESKAESVQDREEKRALHYTYTAILSKLYAIKNHAVEKYIANLNNFLNMFMEKLEEYKEVKKELAIIEENARYKADIDKQIEDAKNVISNSVQPKLEQLFTKIDSEVEELKKEVDQKEEELLEQRKKLEKQKEAMKKNFLARLFANILKVVGAVVSLLGPIGMAAGTAIAGAGALVSKFGVDQSAYEPPDVSNIGSKLNPFVEQFDSAKQQKEIMLKDINNIIDQFTGAKKDFMDVYYTAKNAYKDIKDTASNVMDTYHEINHTYHTVVDEFIAIRDKLNNYGDLNKGIFKECKDVYDKVEKTFNGAIKNVERHFQGVKNVFTNVKQGFSKIGEVGNKIKNAVATVKSTITTAKNAFNSAKKIFTSVKSVATKVISVVEAGGSMVSDIMEDRSQMDKIDQALAANAENLKAVRKFRKGIDDHLKPMLEGMKNTVNNFPKMCEGKSEAQLMTHGWQVEQALDNVICEVNKMTKEFQIGENFKTTLTSIKEAVSLMTNIFKKIQDYGDKKKVADHYAYTQLAGSEIDFKNMELRTVITNLTVAIQANLLLYDYRVWIKQIKLFVFPLPQTYLQAFKVPNALQSEDNTLNGYMTNAIKEVKRFRTQYIESNVYIGQFDKLKHRAFFYKDKQKGPFFVWKNKDHEKTISRLLAGESVVFEALTLRSDMNALKFRRIDLVFRTNKKNQTLLDEILKNYMIRMKHIGNNYYNCENITYVATVVGQTFKFSYQYINREPVDINLVYDKILHGDYMLSPYTTWYIKLINASTDSYKLLLPFQRDVDVELCGEGEFFENKPEVCEDDLSEYFQTKDQFKESKKKNKVKVYTECPSSAIAKKGFLCCEFNSTFDRKDKEWCRAIVRKPETLDSVHNTSEDKNYYYYDRYFRKSALSDDDLKTKFRANCSLHHGDTECIEAFKKRQAYRPWFFYHDKAGGPFSRSYLFCHRGQCLARIEKRKGSLKGLQVTHEDHKYYFYAKLFPESAIQSEDKFKYERCSPSGPDCAPAFENSNLLSFSWDPIPEEFGNKTNKT